MWKPRILKEIAAGGPEKLWYTFSWPKYKFNPRIKRSKTNTMKTVLVVTACIQAIVDNDNRLICWSPSCPHMLSPLIMYRPSWTTSTPALLEYTRSWLPDNMRLIVWSNPLRVPWVMWHTNINYCREYIVTIFYVRIL